MKPRQPAFTQGAKSGGTRKMRMDPTSTPPMTGGVFYFILTNELKGAYYGKKTVYL